MAESIKLRLARIFALPEHREFRFLFAALLTDLTFLRDRLQSQVLGSAGLAISAGGAATAKIVNAIDAICGGVPVTKAANTVLPALAGTILQNNFGGWAFFVDSGGNLTSVFMTQGATLAAVVLPAPATGQALIGYVRLNPTTAPFVGGTTLLDAANTNAVYVNTVGAIDPSTSLQVQA